MIERGLANGFPDTFGATRRARQARVRQDCDEFLLAEALQGPLYTGWINGVHRP